MVRIEVEIVQLEGEHVGIRSRVVHGTNEDESSRRERIAGQAASKAIHDALVSCKDFATVEDMTKTEGV